MKKSVMFALLVAFSLSAKGQPLPSTEGAPAAIQALKEALVVDLIVAIADIRGDNYRPLNSCTVYINYVNDGRTGVPDPGIRISVARSTVFFLPDQRQDFAGYLNGGLAGSVADDGTITLLGALDTALTLKKNGPKGPTVITVNGLSCTTDLRISGIGI